MKQPLLVDKRLNMFMDENTSMFINPEDVNLIEVKRAKLVINKPVELAIEENKEKENAEHEASQQENSQTNTESEEKIEIEGHQVIIYTKKDAKDKHVYFCNDEAGLEFLRRNCEVLNYVVVHIDLETGNRTYLNKAAIKEIYLDKRTEEEIREGKKEILLTLKFESGYNLEDLKDPEKQVSNELYYQIEFDLKEELKEYDKKGELRHYTIMDEFLNSLSI